MGQVIAHPAALGELREAIRYYEDKSAGLGRRFFIEVNLFVQLIITDPTRFSQRIPGVHRANLKRFPFNINYLIEGDGIAIVAIAHDKRKPPYWKNRIPSEGQKPDWRPFSG